MNDDIVVKLGVIGLGNIAKQHIENILSGEVRQCQIVAVCSRQKTSFSDDISVDHFTNYKALIDSGLVDAVLIASPTYSHFDIAQYALQRKLHVMLEKPIGLSSFEGEQLLQIGDPTIKFSLMLNQRTDPTFKKMKNMVESGVLGKIVRIQWTMTNWFRPEVYFQVSDWRATWKGEGGGLLVNQCIHNLDILQWIGGLPNQINALCEFGKFHHIEVEDEVTASFKYDNGATGAFVGSTGEAPGVNRFDIIGDKGSLCLDSGQLIHKENAQSTHAFSQSTKNMFGMPQTTQIEIALVESVNQHACILNNFVDAILNNAPLIAPASEGLASLDMANAMLLSTWQNRWVDLPLDRVGYHNILRKKISQSTFRAKSDVQANVDMSQSFR